MIPNEKVFSMLAALALICTMSMNIAAPAMAATTTYDDGLSVTFHYSESGTYYNVPVSIYAFDTSSETVGVQVGRSRYTGFIKSMYTDGEYNVAQIVLSNVTIDPIGANENYAVEKGSIIVTVRFLGTNFVYQTVTVSGSYKCNGQRFQRYTGADLNNDAKISIACTKSVILKGTKEIEGGSINVTCSAFQLSATIQKTATELESIRQSTLNGVNIGYGQGAFVNGHSFYMNTTPKMTIR